MSSAAHQREIGRQQANRIIEATAMRPMTALELAEAMIISTSAVLIYTARLRAAPRQLHIAGFRVSGSGRPTPLYAAGDLPDATYEAKRKPTLPRRRADTQIERVLAAISVPRTAEQVGVVVSLTASRVRHYIAVLRASKKAYIKGWHSPPARGDLSPIYAAGGRADKPKVRQTRAYRHRKEMENPEQHERILQLKRSHYRLAKAISKPQSLMSALFGAGVRP